VAVAWQRWRLPLVAVLAAAAGLAVGGAASSRGLAGLAIGAGVVLAGGLVAWVVVLPGRLAPPVPEDELAKVADPKARLEAADARLRLRHDLRNGTLQTLAVVAVLAGAVLGFWQLGEDRSNAAADRELTRQGQASERFTRAVNQLSDRRVETRIGGIYGLAQVAEQAPDNNGPVGEVLLAWINHLPRPDPMPTARLSEYAPDLQAALTVLTHFDKDRDGAKDYTWLLNRLDLHALDLRRADLGGADLGGADLGGADLGAADLGAATLVGADLLDARLIDGRLVGADLTRARLGGADLTRVNLIGANLGGANLTRANLTRADLAGATLVGADLRFARLGDADLTWARLSERDRGEARLSGAVANDRTKWPAGFDWRRAGVKPA
jgi:Pentapeptide repeats (8 copies)